MAEPAHGCLATLHQFPAASALQFVQPVCVAVGAVQVASVQVAAQVHAAQAEHPTQYGESHVNTLHLVRVRVRVRVRVHALQLQEGGGQCAQRLGAGHNKRRNRTAVRPNHNPNPAHQPSQKVVWSKQFGEPTKPLHFLQSFWPHVYELHLHSG